MFVKVFKYIVEVGMLVLSGLPILVPARFEYLEKRFAKICCVLAALILCLSILDDISSSIHDRALKATWDNKIRNQEAEISSLKDSQAPWNLSDEQRLDLQASLQDCPKGKIEVSYLISDGLRAGKFA